MTATGLFFRDGPPDMFQRGICHCGHVKHEGVCAAVRRVPEAPCDCAEYVPMKWTPCGTVWFYGNDCRPKSDDGRRY